MSRTLCKPTLEPSAVRGTKLQEDETHSRALKLFWTRTKPHMRMSGGRNELMCAVMSGIPGIAVMSLSETMLPAAWTPASVRAARARETWQEVPQPKYKVVAARETVRLTLL